jgi:hypothetical protein
MNIFGKMEIAPVAPEPISGTETLRRHLQVRARGRSLGQIAGDLNDSEKANRETAASMARRMAGDDASPAAVAAIAKRLAIDFSGEANKVRDVSDALLQAFVDGGDLPAVIKARLAEYLHGGHTTYDGETDRLVSVYTDPPRAITGIPPQWVHPDPAIAAIQAEYKAALQAARRR